MVEGAPIVAAAVLLATVFLARVEVRYVLGAMIAAG